MENFNDIITEACQKRGIKIDIVSDGWVKILQKDGKTRFISQFYFDNNRCGVARILDEKYALYETLKYFNIPVAKHHLLYASTPKEDVLKLFHKYNDNVVVKPNIGSQGRGVYNAQNEEELFTKMDELFANNPSISLCPCYDIDMEYRVIILNGNPELIYGKIKPIVTGDGQKTIKELLLDFNNHYFIDKDLPNDILPKGEKYVYNWKFNLSRGAISTLDIPESKKAKLKDIAKMVYDKLNIAFCSIDIIETKGEFMVLEINSGIAIDKFTYQHENGRKIALDVYGKAIDALFNNE